MNSLQVLSRDDKAKDNAPKVLQGEAQPSSPKGSRPYSTTSRRWTQPIIGQGLTDMHEYNRERGQVINDQESARFQGHTEGEGHMFGLPELPLPRRLHIKHRYDPIIVQVTKLIMQSGKLSQAQRVRSSVSIL